MGDRANSGIRKGSWTGGNDGICIDVYTNREDNVESRELEDK